MMRRKDCGKFQFTVRKKIFPAVIGYLIPYVTLFLYFFGDDVARIFNPLDPFNYIFIGAGVVFARNIFLKRLCIDMCDKGMVFKTRRGTETIYYKKIGMMSYRVEDGRSVTGEHYSELYLYFEDNEGVWFKRVNLDDLPMGKERKKFLRFVLQKNPDIICDEDVIEMCKKGSLNTEKLSLAIMITLSVTATVLPLYGILK